MTKSLIALALSNFIFVSTYALLALHTIFIHDSNEQIRQAVYIGFGIFNSLQVGGVWLLDVVIGKLGFTKSFITFSRIVATYLLFIPNTYSIIISYTLYGLSSAAYYKISRNTLKLWVSDKKNNFNNPFIIFSVSTNLAFIVMPFIGSKLIDQSSILFIGLILNTVMTIGSIYLFPRLNETNITNDNLEDAKESFETLKHLDIFRLILFLFPYAIMITLPPIKVASQGLDSEHSSYLYMINGLVIVLSQVILIKTQVFKFSFVKYDTVTLLATSCCVFSLFADYYTFLFLFSIWSVAESYQMPNIEYLLFGERKYSDKLINRLLVLDSAVCFLGPVFAEKVF